MPRGVLLGLLLVVLMAALPTAALADGDPASDVLSTQPLFLPEDAGTGLHQQALLDALLSSAQRVGYPVRVAIVASRADLGSVTQLWRRPVAYAHFLGTELQLVYKGPLIVVMPNGYGDFQVAGSVPTVSGLPDPSPGLAGAALIAVQKLAAAAGHPLPAPTAAPAPAAGASGGDTVVTVLVFLLGAALIAVAWTASLRAQPWRAAGRGLQPPSA